MSKANTIAPRDTAATRNFGNILKELDWRRYVIYIGFDPAGHAGKVLVHALTALPHDILIGFDHETLERLALTFMSLTDRPRPKLALGTSALARHLYAFAWLPRDELSTARRLAAMARTG